MRRAFIETLSELARKDPTVMLIVGDVGFSFIEDFAAEFPDQYINAGVTEQSMMGMAAGLALSGYKPYVYSMVPFVLMRPYEQVRNDICYNNANVKLIGVRGSVHYKFLGFSHNVTDLEEGHILASLPGMLVHYPTTDQQAAFETRRLYETNGPAFMRI